MSKKLNNKICSLSDLLKMNLILPEYQRPYKWERENVCELLNDIDDAIKMYEKYNSDFKYRIGTIILHEDSKNLGTYNIVDGQQRIITFLLISSYFESKGFKLNYKTLNVNINENLCNNYNYISNYFSTYTDDYIKKIIDSFKNILEVVLFIVDTEQVAFQLFDSQNTRGKELYPHDLLKAYHLRVMDKKDNLSYLKMKEKVSNWEKIEKNFDENGSKINNIKQLFENYLFPIYNWSHKEKTKLFTVKEIGLYKGIDKNANYHYSEILKNRYSNSSKYNFQIYDQIVSGQYFFEMVEYYINFKNDVLSDLKNNLSELEKIESMYKYSKGFQYARNLFECAALCYYDRFLIYKDGKFNTKNIEQFHKKIIKKLFIWAFMLRIDRQKLSESVINRYAIGTEGYSNDIPMFYKIINSNKITDLSNIMLVIKKNENNKNWDELYNILKKMDGGINE